MFLYVIITEIFKFSQAHRTVIVRALKGLDDVIGLSVVDHNLGPKGWKFSTPEECPGAIPDTVNNKAYISELYHMANPEYKGRFTVPVLWDKKLGTIGKWITIKLIVTFDDLY